MAQGDVYRFSLKGTLYGTRVVNVFHFRVDSVPTGIPEEQDISEAFQAVVLPQLVPCLSNQITFNCVQVQNVASLAGNPQDFFLTSGNVGTVVDASLPANKCAVVALYSATYSAHGRGRKYFAGIPVTHEVDNALTVDAKTLWQALAQALQTNLSGGSGGGGYEHVVWSTTLETADTVVRAVAGPQIHALRGRTPARC